jgi:hypothetical protein
MGTHRPDQLRMTLRRGSILVAAFAVISGILAPVLHRLGATGFVNPTLMILLLSPWVLGFLVLLLDRPGPVKYWAAPLLVSLMAPALVACHDWIMIQTWIQYGTLPSLLSTLILNLSLIASFLAYVFYMSPRRCPRCQSRALIPLLDRLGKEKRISNTRWCGAYGSQYWRLHAREEWKTERRRTWIDEVEKKEKEKEKDSKASEPLEKRPGGRCDHSGHVLEVISLLRPQEEPSVPSKSR